MTAHQYPNMLPDSMPVAKYRELLATTLKQSTSKSRYGTVRPPRETPEEDLQRACFSWIELVTLRYPILQYLVHVPNGGARSKGEAGKLKAMGVKPGVPDFLLPMATGQWRGLAIELKSEAGKISEDQKHWLAGLHKEGYLVSVCRSLDSFEKLVSAYLNGQNAPACVERGWSVCEKSENVKLPGKSSKKYVRH